MNLLKSKLHYYLEPLYRSGEWDEFRDYLLSPVFNRDKTLLTFYDAYKKYVFQNGGALGEELYRVAFKGKPFNANHLRERMSLLLRHLYDYFAFCEMQDDAAQKKQSFLRSLSKRGYDRHLQGFAETAIEEMRLQPPGDEEWFLRRLMLEHIILSFELKNSHRTPGKKYKGIDKYLDGFYAVLKLRYALAAANLNRETPGSMAIHAYEPLFHFLKSEEDRLPFLAKCYLYAVGCWSEENGISYFEKLLSMLRQGLKGCEYAVKVELFTTAINFCTQRIRAGEANYQGVSADLHAMFIDEVYQLGNSNLPHWVLKNYISVLLKLSKVEEAEKALKKYSSLVSSQDNGCAVKLAEANICLNTGQSEKAAVLANEVLSLSTDVYYNINARICLWRADFISGDFVSFYPRYQMVRNYLAIKKDIPPSLRSSYINFVKLFKRAGDLFYRKSKMPRDIFRGKLLDLKSDVMESPALTEREWILSMLRQDTMAIT